VNATESTWSRLFVLFECVVDADPATRQRLLDDAGRESPDLRARLERLLALDASERDIASDVADWRSKLDELDDELPSRLGSWRVLREIGSGGMGRVFLATRDDGEYEQTVALKVVRGEFASDAAVLRFLAERRILARLDHPGIAALVDGGVDEHGRPWFAMRYVDGLPLPEYCESHALDLQGRLRLVIAICDAAAYAHRQLVVHCDLKPSNVLVDANGEVHLLDFGVAHLIERPQEGRSAQKTQPQIRALTPGYASPEQLAGKRIGIATDVYAIGAMLYEVLAGRRPYAGQDETPALAAIAQSRGDPVPPSRVAAREAKISARQLRGDIDAIVATALHQDPGQRYPDAASLADDLRRHLGGWPLLAQRDSRLHRIRKFSARHRIAVPVAIFGVLALVAIAAFALTQAREARQQARHADVVRNFLLDLFEQADPDHANGKTLAARDLVDAGARRAEAGLTEDPDTQVELLGVVGGLYTALGDNSQGAAVRERRLALATSRYRPDDPRLAEARIDLAISERESDHIDRPRALIQATLADLRSDDDVSRALRASALGTLGTIERNASHFAEASRLQHERIAILRQIRSTPPDDLAMALNDLASSKMRAGQYADAESDAREALRILHKDAGARPSYLIDVRNTLAGVLTELGRLDEAEAMRHDNVDLALLEYGERNAVTGEEIYALAEVMRMAGRQTESIPLFQHALAIYEQTLGAEHSAVASVLTSLAQAQTETGSGVAAIASLERAYRIDLEVRGPHHINTAIAETALGRARFATNDATGAEHDFRDALAKYSGPIEGHIFAEASRQGLGEALTAQHRYADAEPLLRQAYETLLHAFGAGDFRVESAAIALARCLAAEAKVADAQNLLKTTRIAIEAIPVTSSTTKQLDRLKAAEESLRAR
jgi:serine/threonine protein kinase/tetratricopeptide (TPR) repeat protein